MHQATLPFTANCPILSNHSINFTFPLDPKVAILKRPYFKYTVHPWSFKSLSSFIDFSINRCLPLIHAKFLMLDRKDGIVIVIAFLEAKIEKSSPFEERTMSAKILNDFFIGFLLLSLPGSNFERAIYFPIRMNRICRCTARYRAQCARSGYY